MTNPFRANFRERALRMPEQARLEHLPDFAAASHVTGQLGANPETLRLWKKRADIDAGREPRTTSEAQVEIKRLKKQLVEREKPNEILRPANVFLPPRSARVRPESIRRRSLLRRQGNRLSPVQHALRERQDCG